MPDKSTAPVWLLKYFIKEKFESTAKARKFDLDAFNDAITNIDRVPTVETPSTHKATKTCEKCSRTFNAKAKPTECSFCHKVFHRSSCLPSRTNGSCSPTSLSIPMNASQMSFSSIPASAPAHSSNHGLSSNPKKRSRMNTNSSSVVPTSFSPSTTSPRRPAAKGPDIPTTAPDATVTVVHDEPPTTTDEVPATQLETTENVSILNPNSLSFVASSQSNNTILNSRKKSKQKTPPISPESAKIDYLNLELNSAKTRIVQLDTKIKDQECTIKIQKEKIKLLEQNQHNTANDTYLHPETLPCQSQSHILSHSLHACQCPRVHCGYQHQQSHHYPHQRIVHQSCQSTQVHSLQQDSDLHATLKEIKKSIESVTQSVLNITSVIANGNGKEGRTENSNNDADILDTNELMNENDQGNESVNSIDESVPTLPPVPLNLQVLTS